MSASDRHKTTNYPYRPDPPDLLKRLDEAVGPGKRSRLISLLLSKFLAEEPMPTVWDMDAEQDKPGAKS